MHTIKQIIPNRLMQTSFFFMMISIGMGQGCLLIHHRYYIFVYLLVVLVLSNVQAFISNALMPLFFR